MTAQKLNQVNRISQRLEQRSVTNTVGELTQSDLDKKGSDLTNELTKKFEKRIGEAVKKFEDQVNEKEVKTTEILAIFITLFTFISVNITIFTKVKDLLTATVFMILMVFCSAFLISFILVATSRQHTNRITTWGLLFSLICLALIAIVIFITRWNPVLNT